jgi:hypothetical protein
MEQKIIELFSEIAKPFKDKEGGPKQEIIQAWLNERGLRNEYIPGVGKVINQVDNPRVILVSHMDLIKKFQKGFEENKVYEIIQSKKGKDLIQGALDNTITNAVALLALEHIVGEGIADIEVVLTEGEEVGMVGMTNYIKMFPDKSSNTFFVNLDVTNEGWGKHFSVEYDKPNYHMLKQVQGILSEHKSFFTGSRVCDDIDAVNSADCCGFSYCLPTKDIIHSYKNKARVDSLSGYLEGLIKILINLDHVEEMNTTFHSWHVKKALEIDSFEVFQEELKKITESRRFSYSSDRNYYYSYRDDSLRHGSLFDFEEQEDLRPRRLKRGTSTKPLTAYQLKQRNEYAEMITETMYPATKSNEKEEFHGFILEKIMEDDSFYVSDLALVFRDQNAPLTTAKAIIEELEGYGSLIPITDSEFKFPNPDYLDW